LDRLCEREQLYAAWESKKGNGVRLPRVQTRSSRMGAEAPKDFKAQMILEGTKT
jgi:hypothetical protein